MSALKQSGVIKILAILLLIILAQIPVSLIRQLTYERQTSSQEAATEIAKMAGGSQLVFGPALFAGVGLPINTANDNAITNCQSVHLLPEILDVKADTPVELRSRGIFSMPVYRSNLIISGKFNPKLADSKMLATNCKVNWQDVSVSLGLSDLKGIQGGVSIKWNEQPLEIESGTTSSIVGVDGIHAKIPAPVDQSPIDFEIRLALGGSRQLSFIPLALDTTVEVSSNWSEPSFIGAYLPTSRNVAKAGFKSNWHIPPLAKTLGQINLGDSSWFRNQLLGNSFGVVLLPGIDAQRMTERALRYELLFVFLTFLVFFLFEIFKRLRIHPIQYLLVGAAIVLFYLLLLSLSEQIGFSPAYGLAAMVASALVTGYSKAVLKDQSGAKVVGSLLAALYSFLYVLLIQPDYALLFGAVGLTAVLGTIMYLTRAVDWYGSLGGELSQTE